MGRIAHHSVNKRRATGRAARKRSGRAAKTAVRRGPASLLPRIASDPAVCGGQPCIRGTRIPVALVLDALAEELSPDQIVEHYPHLSKSDVAAAAAYGAELAREGVWTAVANP